MEIVIALVIFAALAYYLFSKRREVETEQEPVSSKVEAPVLTDALLPVQPTPEPVVEVKAEQPVKAKTPRHRAPKPAAKPAQPVKKPAVIQAAPKARKPRAPKAK